MKNFFCEVMKLDSIDVIKTDRCTKTNPTDISQQQNLKIIDHMLTPVYELSATTTFSMIWR